MKRRRFTKEEKQQYFRSWQSSGMSAAEFSKNNNLSQASLWRWERDFSTEKQLFKAATIVGQTKDDPAPTLSGQKTFAQICVGQCTIQLFAGCDPRDIAALLSAFEETSLC